MLGSYLESHLALIQNKAMNRGLITSTNAAHTYPPRHPASCRLLQIVFSTTLGARAKKPRANPMHRLEEKHLCLQVKRLKATGRFADHPKQAQAATELLWSQSTSTPTALPPSPPPAPTPRPQTKSLIEGLISLKISTSANCTSHFLVRRFQRRLQSPPISAAGKWN